MITKSQDYLDAIVSDGREIGVKLIFNDDTTHPITDGILETSIERYTNSGNVLTMGEIDTDKVSITLFMPEENKPLLRGGKVQVIALLKVNGVWDETNLGTFYITEITKTDNNNKVGIVAYDCSTRLSEEYVPHIDYPSTRGEVVADILNQCNITPETVLVDETEVSGYPENSTCQMLLSYMCSLGGKNGRINSNNKFEMYWYDDINYKVELNMIWQDAFNKTTDEPIVIHSLTSGVQNGDDTSGVITAGSGYGMTFDNPYMTQEILNGILVEVDGFTYQPSTLEWRGVPAIEKKDIIQVIGRDGLYHRVLFSQSTLNVLGLKETVTCSGVTEEEVAMDTSPTDIKINKVYTTLIDSFKDATETILGHQGGYFIIDTDEDDHPTGWTIMDTPTLTDDTNLWKMTSGGLGFSSDGGKTFSNVTIDMLGRINANSITTGIIKGEHFDIDLENGTIIMGARDEKGNLSTEWFKVSNDGLEMNVIQEINNTIENVNTSLSQEIQANQDLLSTYIRFNDNGLELGKTDSDFKTLITNEKISFMQGGNEVAYISRQSLYITSGVFLQEQTIGNTDWGWYRWKVRLNGNLSLQYIGKGEK